MMTDDWTMPIGKYVNHRLGDISDDYLIQLYKNKGYVTEGLKIYIENRIPADLLKTKKQTKGESKEKVELAVPKLTCKKAVFLTKDEARKSLQRIRRRGKKRDKQPIRSYECPECGYWHLTSKPDNRFKTNKK